MAVDRLIWKIVLDFFLLAISAFSILSIVLWMEPYHRGYFESDESIRLPFKQQTISETALACSGFAVIILVIIATEVVRDKKNKGIGEKFVSGTLIPGWVWDSYCGIGIYTFGAVLQQLTSEFGKCVIGRLRPHFYDVCQPIPQGTPSQYEYIVNYTCAGTDEKLLKDMRLSFPSAHSSYAMYTAVFLICYIQTKGKWRGSKLLRHVVQYGALMGAWYVGLSRVVDHMHHWSDIAAGFAIGAAFGVLTFIFVLKPKKYGLPGSWTEPAAADNELGLPRPVLTR